MFQSPEYRNTLSQKLCEVLEEAGVNEEIVMKRRRVFLQREIINTATRLSIGENVIVHYLGSQSEGTTTEGLHSDVDILNINQNYNVIQDWSEWKQNKTNFLMIQDENITPGYCCLQLLRSDLPLFATANPGDDKYVRDGKGRILLRNTSTTWDHEDVVRQGPSNAIRGNEGYSDIDIVNAFPCYSVPRSASEFLKRYPLRREMWPSSEIVMNTVRNRCFVVGVSSKISICPDIEWRISTSLAERCIMFNLNITQIQCYVLMKIISKTFLKEKALSSFMCKTTLFHCILKTERNIWNKNNIYICLTYCLLELMDYILSENCPHFVISENNLMAGQFIANKKRELLQKINDTIESDGRYLLRIDMDGIGQRLQDKMNASPLLAVHGIHYSHDIYENCLSMLFFNLAKEMSKCQLTVFANLSNDPIKKLWQIICKLVNYHSRGNSLDQVSIRCFLPFLFTTLGSIMLSSSITNHSPVKYEALKWLSIGLNSDVSSSKLKLASVYYCLSDKYRSEIILRQVESQFNREHVEPVCNCWRQPFFGVSAEFKRKCCQQSENKINQVTSFCVRFTKSEVNFVPRELQYEMVRSAYDDMPNRSENERLWMNHAVIDSLPYLYFLQYKTYKYQQRYDKLRALRNLARVIFTRQNFGHRESAFNLLGQCLEQENKSREALQCYILSLRQRQRNNAAKIHLCHLIRKHVLLTNIRLLK